MSQATKSRRRPVGRQASLATAAAVAVAATILAAPAAAPAATSCSFGSQTLEVLMPAANDSAALQVLPSGEIRVDANFGTTLSCAGGPPSVTTTNAISVSNQPGSSANVVEIRTASSFAPGATPEPGDDEIEIFVNLNDAPGSSQIRVFGDDNLGAFIRFGSGGVNPNATPAEDTPDADIFPTNVPNLGGFGKDGPDVLGAQGGAGTGGPLTGAIALVGGPGADHLTGGEGADQFVGGTGSDSLFGKGGPDVLRPGKDDDFMDGGLAPDVAFFDASPDTTGGITVDLALTGPQSTGGSGDDVFASIEGLVGTDFADVLRGDGGPNALDGREGDDVLEGRGGVDGLEGGTGADSLEVRDGGPDTAECGPDTDTVTADLPGVDAVSECETALFPTVEADEPPGDGPPAADGPSPDSEDRVPPAISGLSLSRRAFSVGRAGTPRSGRRGSGTSVRFRLSEPATVRIAIERRARGARLGRRWVRKGTLRRSANAGANRVAFSGRIGRRKLRPGRHRLTLVATDAAGNRSRPKRVAFLVVPR